MLVDKERFAQELVELSKGQDDTLLYKMPKKPLTAYMFFVREVSLLHLNFSCVDSAEGGARNAGHSASRHHEGSWQDLAARFRERPESVQIDGTGGHRALSRRAGRVHQHAE